MCCVQNEQCSTNNYINLSSALSYNKPQASRIMAGTRLLAGRGVAAAPATLLNGGGQQQRMAAAAAQHHHYHYHTRRFASAVQVMAKAEGGGGGKANKSKGKKDEGGAFVEGGLFGICRSKTTHAQRRRQHTTHAHTPSKTTNRKPNAQARTRPPSARR
jgi:hypothetical protein